MRLKVFSVKSRNGRTRFDQLEAEVNAWLDANPSLEVKGHHPLSLPVYGWRHTAIAVWVDEVGKDWPAAPTRSELS